MKNIVIVMIVAVLASVATVMISKSIGINGEAWIGGAVGGAVSGFLAVKLANKSSDE